MSRQRRREVKMKVTKQTLIGAIIDYDTDAAKFFFDMGMYCLGCPHARGESIEEACAAHGTDADKLVENLNAFFESKAQG